MSLVHAFEKWDIQRSFALAKDIRAVDPDLCQPGWCWNSAIAATLFLNGYGEEGAVYVEGWLHNRHELSPYKRYPHGWTVLGDGTIIDTCSGGEPGPAALAASLLVFYEQTQEWTVEDLEALIVESDPTPPLTPEYDNWTPEGESHDQAV